MTREEFNVCKRLLKQLDSDDVLGGLETVDDDLVEEFRKMVDASRPIAS